MTEFENKYEKTKKLLDEKKDEWENRYGGYIESMSIHENEAIKCYNKFKSTEPFKYHLSMSELKNKVHVFTYSVRFLGQEVATITVNNEGTYISTKGKEEANKHFEYFEELPEKTKWDSTEAKAFREFFKKCEKLKGKSAEHALESKLITELSKESSEDKLLCGIQPVRIKKSSLRFSMKTPLTASGDDVKYSGSYGGCIDILARCNGNLTVIELKDEYTSKEPPKKALKQAIAYATFIYKLLRSDKTNAKKWYKFFGYISSTTNENFKMKENLTINVVVAMPKNSKGDSDKSFALQEIKLDKKDKLILHYMYLDLDENNEIIGIDSSLNKINNTIDNETETDSYETETINITENEPYIKIHRGTDQIGGTVTEIKSNKGRIFIDFGTQLQGAENITTLNIEGLTQGDADSTLLLTHYHGDHIGEIHRILDAVPVYIGEIAKDISIALCNTLIRSKKAKKAKEIKAGNIGYKDKDKDKLIKKKAILKRAENYVNKKSFYIEDMKITPYKVDHSAFDSYMLLIEVDGKKILHTGDYRFHGHQGDELMKNIEEMGTIDYLITEGTTLSRENIPHNTLTQEEYTEKLKAIFKEHKKVAVLCSSTNIDHLASVQKALPDKKIILCDAYQKSILDVVTKHQKKSNQELSDIYKFEDKNISLFNYSKNKDKPEQEEYCALIRKAKQPDFITNEEFNQDIYIVYSLWTGYLKGKHVDPKMKKLQDLYGDRFIKLHTSGHVYKEDLQKMIGILKPKKGIIPIHTEDSDAFNDISCGCKVLKLNDGQEIKI